MEIINASDAKREFGDMLLKVQKDPVGINKNGKPVAVMMSASEYADYQAVKRQMLQKAIDEGIEDVKAGRIVDGDTAFEAVRKSLFDA